jgi:hypothetical protein
MTTADIKHLRSIRKAHGVLCAIRSARLILRRLNGGRPADMEFVRAKMIVSMWTKQGAR